MIGRAVLLILGLMLATAPALAQQFDRVVALVVSVGDGAKRADAIQTQLQLMNAETLRSDGPNNAELRSILMRFAREAANSKAALIYLDVPAVNFEGRDFVLPSGAILNRPTDLFTQAIPIQAFSRSASQADESGAVVMTVTAPSQDLPADVSVVKHAPDPVPGSGPVLVATTDAFGPILATFEAAAGQEEIEVGAMLRRMAAQADVTISGFPANPIRLREKATPKEPPTPPPAVASTTEPAILPPSTSSGNSAAASPQPSSEPSETPEELALIEESLSRSAKRSIQAKLRDLGFYHGLVDSIFGTQTRDAIKAFQKGRSEEQTGVLNRRQLITLSS